MKKLMTGLLAAAAAAGCCWCGGAKAPEASATAALDAGAWKDAQWLSVKDAPALVDPLKKNEQRAADGTSWFAAKVVNAGDVTRAVWMTTGLGVYEIFVNGARVGRDALKPGFTHVKKTRVAFTYDVTPLMKTGAGAENVFAAEVSAGWWRDKIVNFAGVKSAFRGVLEVTHADGSVKRYVTNTADWKCGVAGPVKHAAIFDGEEYDARVAAPTRGEGLVAAPEANTEFTGEVVPTCGAEICRRCDKALAPVEAYVWEGVEGANGKTLKDKDAVFGTVKKTRVFTAGEPMTVKPGETLVVDFGQNAAAVPCFTFSAKQGTVLTALPGEMLNDSKGERARGNDGPAGSLYRENLRVPKQGMRAVYTFAGDGVEKYMPRHTFFGYRYVSVTATDEVTITSLKSVPVTSITPAMETGSITTGVKDVNKLISNVYWGQLSNYLSVPTDCPQRNERLGWTADTQVFCEAGTFNADTSRFFHKWMRDMRDSQHARGGFPGVAPLAQYGNDCARLGWADAGIIVPWTMWLQFGDVKVLEENWAAMEKYMARIDETKFQTENLPECGNYQWADWLSLTKYESCPYKPELSAFGEGRKPRPETLKWWGYLGGSYLTWNAGRMAVMARALGKDAAKYEKMEKDARAYMKAKYFNTPDGTIDPLFKDMQTALLFALRLDFVAGAARAKTAEALRANIIANDVTLHTGFLGTSIAMDTLSANGMTDLAYALLLNHKFPGWLYSVDQGATTIWERWNSYVKATGFGPVGMNSFNHYAYGAVLAWIYKTAAGIAADPAAPGYKNIVMAPQPDERLGSISAAYRTPAGTVKSAWHYVGKKWVWEFTIPAGATATVTVPGEKPAQYTAGTYKIER